MSAVKEFKEFILRGNVVDLAVGVVIGAAFGAVVKAFTEDIITPLIGIPGKISFGDWTFVVHGSKFAIGAFINQVVTFLLTSAVVFFFVVKPLNAVANLRKVETAPETPTRECPECLSKIPAAATRCAFCTAVSPAQPAS
jgi:large conductance mechanosensitive channel